MIKNKHPTVYADPFVSQDSRDVSRLLFSVAQILNKNSITTIVLNDDKYERFLASLASLRYELKKTMRLE